MEIIIFVSAHLLSVYFLPCLQPCPLQATAGAEGHCIPEESSTSRHTE